MVAGGPAVIAAAMALLASLYIHVLNDFGPLDIYAPPQVADATDAESFFSDSYYHARALFRTHAEAAELKLFTLPLDEYAHLDLTIDVAVLDGAKDRVVLHISGTHGVEGFAGSAIQSALLKRAAKDGKKRKSDAVEPTVIFVHALNAYGFSQLRRFNEHNVDLNRNWLTPEQFQSLASQNPNKNGYMDLYDMLNPPGIGGALDSFWAKAAYHCATKGVTVVKRAIVSGNYHFPNATYYGGNKLEPSLVLLQQFLKQHVDLDNVHAFGMIDVHTGLGPAGFDTLLLGSSTDMKVAAKVFGEYEKRANKLTPVNGDANGVSQGYDSTAGFTLDGVAALLPQESRKNSVLIGQEFGTVPGVFIVKAMIEESFAYRHAPSKRLPYAEKLRDVFYLHRSASWKQSVVQRGVAVYEQVYEHIATCT